MDENSVQNALNYGYMRRRIEAMEREQSLLGKRIDELEARLRAENDGPIPGDIGLPVDEFVLRHNFPPSDATPGSETAQIEAEYFMGTDGQPYRAYRMLPPEQEDDPR